MKILEIPKYNQRDPRWKDQRLGTVNSTTIGSDGCVISCHAMNLTWRGKTMTPADLDNFLTDNNLYYAGNLWVPSRASQILSTYKHIRTVYCEQDPAPLDQIKAAIDKNQPPTLWVWNGGVKHNVLATGYDGNQIYVNDPWMGDRVRMDQRWGDSASVILSVDFYEGPMPPTNEEQVTMPKSRADWFVGRATTAKEVAAHYDIPDPDNADQTTIIAKIDKMINAYKGQVSQAQADAAQARKDLATANQEVLNREEQVSRLKDQLLNEDKLNSDLQSKLTDALNSLPTIKKVYEDRISTMQGQIDTMGAEKGELVIKLQTLTTQNQQRDQKINDLMKAQCINLSASELLKMAIKKIGKK